jgi:hypothetical protein
VLFVVVLSSCLLFFLDPWTNQGCSCFVPSFVLSWPLVVGWGFFRTGDNPVVLYENLFIVAACILKKFENGAVAVGRRTRLCRIFLLVGNTC